MVYEARGIITGVRGWWRSLIRRLWGEPEMRLSRLAGNNQAHAPKARLCVDYTEQSTFEAIDILRQAGFRVTGAPVSGLIEPEVTLGSKTYRGLAQIRKVAQAATGKAKSA